MDSGLKARTTEKSFEEAEDDFMAELEDDGAILGAFRERRLQEYQLQYAFLPRGMLSSPLSTGSRRSKR